MSSNRALQLASAKVAELERELKKCPDFHLYLVTKTLRDRERMKRILLEIPIFKLWLALSDSITSNSGVR